MFAVAYTSNNSAQYPAQLLPFLFLTNYHDTITTK